MTIQFLKIAKKHNLYFKWFKCDFDIKEISILGVVVGREEVQIENNKIKAIKKWKISIKIKKSRKFLGVCKFLLTIHQEFQSYGKTS